MSQYTTDIKEPVNSELPIYQPLPSDDTVELAVGGAPARRGCFWKRFRCHHADGQERKKRSFARRLFRGVMALFLVLGITGFFLHKHKMGCMMKHHPVVCVPLETADTSLTLPLANWRTHIAVHNSLTAGDVHVTHSDDVEEGHVSFKFDVPKDVKYNDDEETPELFLCHIAGPRFVGLGIESKGKDVKAPKATSTTITLSSKEAGHSRAINLLGPRPKFGHGRGWGMQQRIRKAIRKEVRRAARAAAWEMVEHSDAE